MERVRTLLFAGGFHGPALLHRVLYGPLNKYLEVCCVLFEQFPYGNTKNRIYTILNRLWEDEARSPYEALRREAPRMAKEAGVHSETKPNFSTFDVNNIIDLFDVKLILSATCGYIWRLRQLERLEGNIFNFHPTGYVERGQEHQVLPRYVGTHAAVNILEDLARKRITGAEIVMHQATPAIDLGRIFARSGPIWGGPVWQVKPYIGEQQKLHEEALQMQFVQCVTAHAVPTIAEQSLPYLLGLSKKRPAGVAKRELILEGMREARRSFEERKKRSG
ncbi:MAG: hypothetical protein KDD69_15780 [Bdellovibrionales bacterium]|nr:hypothetical protein [Bdellovibrionales bacterium]